MLNVKKIIINVNKRVYYEKKIINVSKLQINLRQSLSVNCFVSLFIRLSQSVSRLDEETLLPSLTMNVEDASGYVINTIAV